MIRRLALVLLLLMTASCVSVAERPVPWPEGWSEVRVLDSSSIHRQGFALASHPNSVAVAAVAWVDGTFVWELEVNYGLVDAGGQLSGITTLSSQPGKYSNPDMVTDFSGTSHIVWEEEQREKYLIHYARVEDGRTDHTVLVESQRPLKDVTLARGDDRVHVFWSDQRESSFEIYHMAVDKHGEVTVAPHQVTRTGGTSSIPTAVVDPEGKVHLVWAEMTEPKEKLYYLVLDQGGNEAVAPSELGTVAAQVGDRLFLGFRDGVVLVWPDYAAVGTQVVQLYFGELGGNGVSRRSLTPSSIQAVDPSGTWDEEGNLHLVWTDSEPGIPQTYYGKIGSSGEFNPVRLDVDKSASFHPDLVLSEGNALVLWTEANTSGRSQISAINTKYPRKTSLWTKMGIDRDNPLSHLTFSVLGNLFMTVFLTVMNLTLLIAGILFVFVLRWVGLVADFNCNRWVWVLVMGTFLWVMQATPLFMVPPTAYGHVLDAIGLILPTLAAMAIVYATRVDWNEGLTRAGLVVVWVMWSIFFLRIPESLFV